MSEFNHQMPGGNDGYNGENSGNNQINSDFYDNSNSEEWQLSQFLDNQAFSADFGGIFNMSNGVDDAQMDISSDLESSQLGISSELEGSQININGDLEGSQIDPILVSSNDTNSRYSPLFDDSVRVSGLQELQIQDQERHRPEQQNHQDQQQNGRREVSNNQPSWPVTNDVTPLNFEISGPMSEPHHLLQYQDSSHHMQPPQQSKSADEVLAMELQRIYLPSQSSTQQEPILPSQSSSSMLNDLPCDQSNEAESSSQAASRALRENQNQSQQVRPNDTSPPNASNQTRRGTGCRGSADAYLDGANFHPDLRGPEVTRFPRASIPAPPYAVLAAATVNGDVNETSSSSSRQRTRNQRKSTGRRVKSASSNGRKKGTSKPRRGASVSLVGDDLPDYVQRNGQCGSHKEDWGSFTNFNLRPKGAWKRVSKKKSPSGSSCTPSPPKKNSNNDEDDDDDDNDGNNGSGCGPGPGFGTGANNGGNNDDYGGFGGGGIWAQS